MLRLENSVGWSCPMRLAIKPPLEKPRQCMLSWLVCSSQVVCSQVVMLVRNCMSVLLSAPLVKASHALTGMLDWMYPDSGTMMRYPVLSACCMKNRCPE